MVFSLLRIRIQIWNVFNAMSEIDKSITEILLPKASVMVFTQDEQTKSSFSALRDDWRYSRVTLRCEDGGVDEAIKKFAQIESPDLVILQTEEIDDAFTKKLESLANNCREGTSAIVIGPVNDVYLYRRLIDMGVSDYLVKPMSADILSGVIAKSLIEKLGVSDSRLIAVIGAKGGVGVSSIAQLMALLLARVVEQKTLLLDAAGGHSALSVGLGFDPTCKLADLARAVQTSNEDAMKRMLFRSVDNLTVVSGGGDAILDGSIPPESFEAIIDQFMAKNPVVVVDLSGAEAGLSKRVISRANNIVLVTTPTVLSLRFARALLKEISDVRGGNKDGVEIFINKRGLSKSAEISKAQVDEALGRPVSTHLAFLPDLFTGSDTEISNILDAKDTNESVKSALLAYLSKIYNVSDLKTTKEDKKTGGIGSFITKLKTK